MLFCTQVVVHTNLISMNLSLFGFIWLSFMMLVTDSFATEVDRFNCSRLTRPNNVFIKLLKVAGTTVAGSLEVYTRKTGRSMCNNVSANCGLFHSHRANVLLREVGVAGIREQIGNCIISTILRDPIERVASWFYYMTALQDQPRSIELVGRHKGDFDAFVKEVDPKELTHYLDIFGKGTGSVSVALQELALIDVVGVTEKFYEFMTDLSLTSNIPISYMTFVREKVIVNRPSISSVLSQEGLDRLNFILKDEYILYNYVKKRALEKRNYCFKSEKYASTLAELIRLQDERDLKLFNRTDGTNCTFRDTKRSHKLIGKDCIRYVMPKRKL